MDVSLGWKQHLRGANAGSQGRTGQTSPAAGLATGIPRAPKHSFGPLEKFYLEPAFKWFGCVLVGVFSLCPHSLWGTWAPNRNYVGGAAIRSPQRRSPRLPGAKRSGGPRSLCPSRCRSPAGLSLRRLCGRPGEAQGSRPGPLQAAPGAHGAGPLQAWPRPQGGGGATASPRASSPADIFGPGRVRRTACALPQRAPGSKMASERSLYSPAREEITA